MPPVDGESRPPGFITTECYGVNAHFLMPESWFYTQEEAPGTQAYFMTQQRIQPGQLYETGLSMQVVSQAKARLGHLPVAFARNFLINKPDMQNPSELVNAKNGNLVIFRRHFDLPEMTLFGRSSPAKHFYFALTANNTTDKVYIISFETTPEKWEHYRQTAAVMIEESRLDPNY